MSGNDGKPVMPATWPTLTPEQRAEAQRLNSRAAPVATAAALRGYATDDEYYAALDAGDARAAAARAAQRAASAPARTPSAPVARPTTSQPEVTHFVNSLPTISNPTGSATPETDGNIRYMPSTSRGAVANSAEDTLMVYTADPRNELAQATSHLDVPTMELSAEARNLAASVKAAEERVAAARDPVAKAQAQAQLARANERAAYGMARLAEIARTRGGV